MRFVKTALWAGLFVVATFFWVVLFEHGFGNFGLGVKTEFEDLRGLFKRD